jgi:hypothetical protein
MTLAGAAAPDELPGLAIVDHETTASG